MRKLAIASLLVASFALSGAVLAAPQADAAPSRVPLPVPALQPLPPSIRSTRLRLRPRPMRRLPPAPAAS